MLHPFGQTFTVALPLSTVNHEYKTVAANFQGNLTKYTGEVPCDGLVYHPGRMKINFHSS